MSEPRQTLPEPVEVHKFWANRRGEAVIVAGTLIVDVRRHYTAADGTLKPTGKGIALTVAKLPELTAAINKALAKAKQLGLVDDEAGHG
jgi:ABC-type amino acid transport substrate-binding protein